MKMFLYGILVFFGVCLNELYAQLSPSTPKFDFALTNKRLNQIEKQVLSEKLERRQTSEILENLDTLRTQIAQEKTEALDNLETTLKKLKALDALSGSDGNEPKEIRSQRQKFNLQADKVKTKIANAELAKAKIDEINGLILKKRNSKLFNDIMLKESSILHPKEFGASLLSFFKFTYELALSPFHWFDNIPEKEQKLQKNSLILVGLLLLAVWLFTYKIGYFIKKHFGYAQNIDVPNPSQKLKASLWEWLARGGIPAITLTCFLFWIAQEHLIISSDFGFVNMTYADKIGRTEINVSVAYDCDIELVKQKLIDIALQNSFVMKNPSPSVSICNFTSFGLELQLNCFIDNVYNKGSVTNDLKEEILKSFRELGINFPMPCQIIKIQNDD